jgi:hypothetical protein
MSETSSQVINTNPSLIKRNFNKFNNLNRSNNTLNSFNNKIMKTESMSLKKFHSQNFKFFTSLDSTNLSSFNMNNKWRVKKELRRLRRIIKEKDQSLISKERELRKKEIENHMLKIELENLKNEEKQKYPYVASFSSNIVIIEEEEDDYEMNFFSYSDLPESSDIENQTAEVLMDEEIDPDNMTYEELLELQDRIGYVSRGFSEKEIKLIPKLKFDKSLLNFLIDDKICTICQYEYRNGQDLRYLKCKHSFHINCVDFWFKKEKVCPNCKEEVVLKNTREN